MEALRRRRRWGRAGDVGATDHDSRLDPPAFSAARRILLDRRDGRPIPGPDHLCRLATQLRGPGSRRVERRLLALALEQRPHDLALRHKLALATYKDNE